LLHLAGWSFNFNGWLPSWAWIFGSDFLDVSSACSHDCKGVLDTALALRPFYTDWIPLVICAAAVTLVVGMIGRSVRGDNDDPWHW
jgi:hypothetical protein